MNRKPAPSPEPSNQDWLQQWHRSVFNRRQFLLASVGGAVTALMPSLSFGSTIDPWQTLDSVQRHLFPSETDSPGAKEINALGYLRFVVADSTLDKTDREFILQGTRWLEDISMKLEKTNFSALSNANKERLLRHIASSDAGENWLSTLLLYICEALLTDPVYGGNTNQTGWRWLQHTPGFPRPPQDKRYPELLARSGRQKST